MPNSLTRSITIIILAIGGLILTTYLIYSTIEKVITWEHVEGNIIDFTYDGYPLVSFEYHGKTYQFSLFSKHDEDEHTKRSVEVLFPAGQPEMATEKTFINLWSMPLLSGIFTIIFGLYGVTGFATHRKKKAHNTAE
ncbi:MAG: hypothetical protein HOP08_05250 [Cyclobacteriaceae bacterium]|nr:hypothetical protein [Cyclobacteriaceae bacterium]